MGVAKRDDAVADDHRDDRVGARAAPVHRFHRAQYGVRCQGLGGLLAQFVGEHVQQHLGVRTGVQVTPVALYDQPFELRGVHEVAVVGQRDAVGRIDVKRLGFRHADTPRRGVPDMSQSHVALQPQHVLVLENVAHQPVGLAQMELAARGGHDPRGVLAPVLKTRQRIVEPLVDGPLTDDSDDSAHDD